MNPRSEAHARHDRHLVAALAADDLEPVVRTEAEALVASCRDCAELFADLKTIALATAALPDVPRTRDFRITAADAARLQPRGWRALLDAIGGARGSFSRPLAAGLTTLGLVGLLATTVPSALNGQSFGAGGAAPPAAIGEDGRNFYASAAPASQGPVFGSVTDGASPAPAAFGSVAPTSADTSGKSDVPSPRPTGESVQAVATAAPNAGGLGAIPPPGTKGGRGTGVAGTGFAHVTTGGSAPADRLASTTGRPGTTSLLLLASIVCLVAGLGLFAARWGARRLVRR